MRQLGDEQLSACWLDYCVRIHTTHLPSYLPPPATRTRTDTPMPSLLPGTHTLCCDLRPPLLDLALDLLVLLVVLLLLLRLFYHVLRVTITLVMHRITV
eukprot:COSAG06_NODE_19139_length_851_cov_147.542553_2_plen_99_part_00